MWIFEKVLSLARWALRCILLLSWATLTLAFSRSALWLLLHLNSFAFRYLSRGCILLLIWLFFIVYVATICNSVIDIAWFWWTFRTQYAPSAATAHSIILLVHSAIWVLLMVLSSSFTLVRALLSWWILLMVLLVFHNWLSFIDFCLYVWRSRCIPYMKILRVWSIVVVFLGGSTN